MKVLFLDIDGVLNSHRWYAESIGKLNVEQRNAMTRRDHDLLQIDPTAVANLEQIVNAFDDIEIIVSSTWRRLHPLAEIRDFISTRGGKKSSTIIAGKTCFMPNKMRGYEIEEHVSQFLDSGDTYVILDDDTDMLASQKKHFVHTQHFEGLTLEKAQEAIKVLMSTSIVTEDSCCEKEERTMDGGCKNCGDPSF